MAVASRWERERGAWALEHSRAGTSARRRAELLARDSRRTQRDQHGLGAAVVQDEATSALWRRVMTGEGRSPVKAVTFLGAVVVGGVVGGVGVGVGYAAYQGLWRESPRIGRLWAWPWATAAGSGAALAWTTGLPLGVSVQFTRHFPIDVIQVGPWGAWAVWQLVIALATVAYLVRTWGWAGVPAGAVIRDPRRKDGTFKKTPDSQKIRLDPEREHDAPGRRVWDRAVTYMTTEGKKK